MSKTRKQNTNILLLVAAFVGGIVCNRLMNHQNIVSGDVEEGVDPRPDSFFHIWAVVIVVALFAAMGWMFRTSGGVETFFAVFIVIILIWELIQGAEWNIWDPLKWTGGGLGGVVVVVVCVWLFLGWLDEERDSGWFGKFLNWRKTTVTGYVDISLPQPDPPRFSKIN